jgi:hypothetical protein
MEFYAQPTDKGYEIPCVIDKVDLLDKAEVHLDQSDYKAAAVYTRSAFEQIIRNYCNRRPKKKIPFHQNQKQYTSEHFWTALKDGLEATLVTEVEQYRDLVLNPFSHYNTEKHEIRTELTTAIQTIKTLKTALTT